MVAGTLLFVAGVVLLQLQAELPAPGWAICIPLLLAAVRYWPSLRYPLYFLMGFFWALFHAQWTLSHGLESRLEGRDLWAEGVISSLPDVQMRHTRFQFHIHKLFLDGKAVSSPGLVRLTWYNQAPELVAGDRWRLLLRLKRPHGFANPGGFDYEGWMFRNGIRATGYVRPSEKNRYAGEGGFGYGLQRWRQATRGLIHGLLPRKQAALVTALVIGDRSGIERADWDLFARSGTSHLFAISGLHIGIVAGLGYLLVYQGWRRFRQLTLRLPAQQAGAVAALVFATGYAALAGFSLPTQRALVMLFVFFGAQLQRRVRRPFHTLLLALGVVVVLDPTGVLSAGFWLSFGAVAVILYGVVGRPRGNGLFWKWGRVQWFVSLGLIPVLIAWNLQVSLVAPLVNLVAVPAFSFVIVPVALAGTVLSSVSETVGQPLLQGVGWVLIECLNLLEILADLPYISWVPPSPPSWTWIPGMAGILVLLMPRGLPGRWLGLILVLPLALLRHPGPDPGALWFTLLDVGDGLAVVVRTANHTLIFDTGARFSGRFDAGGAVVVPFLQAVGVNRVDRVVISNGDMDHRGGLQTILAAIEVGSLISGEPEGVKVHREVSYCAETESWYWDGVEFAIIHPDTGREWQGNNASCVLRVASSAGTILIPGDIERGAERYLLRRRSGLLDVDVVVVPHHGSNTSSSQGFTAAVRPRYALVSTGYRNRYGFPKESVVERWRGAGAVVIDTVQSGAIEIRLESNGSLSEPRRFRSCNRRYWMDKVVDPDGS